jgi:hypothetical protein
LATKVLLAWRWNVQPSDFKRHNDYRYACALSHSNTDYHTDAHTNSDTVAHSTSYSVSHFNVFQSNVGASSNNNCPYI